MVEGTRTKVVSGDEEESVGKDQKIIVLGQKALRVEKDLERTVRGDETNEIGREVGAGVLRDLASKKDRLTRVEGSDTRTVGGEQRETIGGTYQHGGEPLAMKATAPAAAAPGAPPTVTSDDRQLTLDGGGAETELRAHGDLFVCADEATFTGATGVRFECGDEVWLELTPGGIEMVAPGGMCCDPQPLAT